MNRREAMQAIGAAILFGSLPASASSSSKGMLILRGRPVTKITRIYLEPVGLEWDGSYRPINQLSYKPVR